MAAFALAVDAAGTCEGTGVSRDNLPCSCSRKTFYLIQQES